MKKYTDKELLHLHKVCLLNRGKCTVQDLMDYLEGSRKSVLTVLRFNPFLFRKYRSKDINERELIFRCDLSDSQESKNKFDYIRETYEECENAKILIGTILYKEGKCDFNSFCSTYLKYCSSNFKSSMSKNAFFQSRRQVNKFFKE